MTVKNSVIILPKEEIIMDDIENKKDNSASEAAENMDLNKLADLKAKIEAKKNKESKKKNNEPARSIRFGIVGSGQGGSRLAESFYRIGYDAAVLNTTASDLQHIEIPDSNKLLLNYSVGGAAKSLEIGRDAALANKEAIQDMINNQLADAQMFVFCSSLGGGSGAGSIEILIDILAEIGKPILVIGILPMNSDDALAKSNSLQVLNKLLKYVQNKTICNLIVVDNAKIEAIYHDVGQMDFFTTANNAIVAPLEAFNSLSSQASKIKALDQMEFVKLLTSGEGLSVYGEFNVQNYAEDETSIAEAIISSLSNNLLSGGFDIKQSRYVGAMFCASKKVWAKIPSSSINYAMSCINEECGSPISVFRGIYEIDTEDDFVKVYSFFSGLGLPDSRVDQLQKEVKINSEVIKSKDNKRNMTLNIDTGEDQFVSEAAKIKEKMATKASTFGKFLKQNVIDRRK